MPKISAFSCPLVPIRPQLRARRIVPNRSRSIVVKGSLATHPINPQHHVPILTTMKRLICYIRNFLARLTKSRRDDGLTAVEYEAVCLIPYKGRAAFARTQQQAFYYRSQGSEQGFRFWSAVAVEIDRWAGVSAKRADEQSL
jgi:hypothetical protein